MPRIPLPFGPYIRTLDVNKTDPSKFVQHPYGAPDPNGVKVTQTFGETAYSHGLAEFYYAIDFLLGFGAPVLAQGNGRVISVYETVPDGDETGTKADENAGVSGIGNQVTVLYNEGTPDQFYATYQHLQHNGVVVNEHDTVTTGQILGYVGNTGQRDTTHLHVTYGNKYIHWQAGDVANGSTAVNSTAPVLFATSEAPDGLLRSGLGNAPEYYYLGDNVVGGPGSDMLTGGAGNEFFTGGLGADVFVLSSGNDVITDFDPGSGDRIGIPPGTTVQTVFTQVGGDGRDTVLTHGGGTLTLADPATQNLLVSIDESWFVTATTESNKLPQIVQVETFHEGELVYFRLGYHDPDNDAVGFGFRGVKGAGWASEEHFFTNPSYGRVSPGQVEYPFNHLCGTGSAYESDVAAYIFDAAGNHSSEVEIHLACSSPIELDLFLA